MRIFKDVADIAQHKGQDIGVSAWMTVDQPMIEKFAAATGDFNWIHTDPERTQKELGQPTIAHGFLTLSLFPQLLYKIQKVESMKRSFNYGTNQVRFVSAVPVNSRIRAHMSLKDVVQKAPGNWLLSYTVKIEVEGQEKPAVVAELLDFIVE